VQLCAKSKDDALQQWAFSRETGLEMVSFYLEWSDKNHSGSMKLALDALAVLVTQNPAPEVGAAIRDGALEAAFSIIGPRTAQSFGKSAYGLLYFFLNKPVCATQHVLNILKSCRPCEHAETQLDTWRQFIGLSFDWMEVIAVSSIAGKTIALVMRNLSSEMNDFEPELWRTWLSDGLTAHPTLLEEIRLHILGQLFKIDKKVSLQVLQVFNSTSLARLSINQELRHSVQLQLAALDVGKKAGLVEEPRPDVSRSGDKAIALDKDMLDALLAHPSHDTRSTAFALLVNSQATTKPLTAITIGLLRRHLPAYHSDFDAKFRTDLLSNIKYMLWRAASGMPSTAAIASVDGGEPRSGESMQKHNEFLYWYFSFLKAELRPTASYPRHITALKAIAHFLRGRRAGSDQIPVVDSAAAEMLLGGQVILRLIVDRIMDAFADVREQSALLLKLLIDYAKTTYDEDEFVYKQLIETVGEVASRTAAMALHSCRADHADGAARSSAILLSRLPDLGQRLANMQAELKSLKLALDNAEKDFGRAVSELPLHGVFTKLRYSWEMTTESSYVQITQEQANEAQQLQSEIVAGCRRTWRLVEHVLCDDSPEGHMPEELEDQDGLDTTDVLSYSFRAVDESSILLRSLIAPFKAKPPVSNLVPSPETFADIGSLALEQLRKLRHRGAIAAVGKTFTACCQSARAAQKTQADADCLLRSWYEKALSCIMTEKSTTRRSAGIPSLIIGVLAASSSSPSFDEVFRALRDIGSRQPDSDSRSVSYFPQVHAMNCLKEIFRTSMLRKKVEPYLTEGLQLAASSLRSDVWAVRNSALILLRSLIDCLVNGEHASLDEANERDADMVRINFERYPGLIAILAAMLRTGLDGDRSIYALFPALDIIRRAGPLDKLPAELQTLVDRYEARGLLAEWASGSYGLSPHISSRPSTQVGEISDKEPKQKPASNGVVEYYNDAAVLASIPPPSALIGEEEVEELCELCVDICIRPGTPDDRIAALEKLSPLIERFWQISNGRRIPAQAGLQDLWKTLTEDTISPSLYCAFLTLSGMVMGMVTSGAFELFNTPLQSQLTAWSAMLSDALVWDNTFDVRMAAAQGLRAYTRSLGGETLSLPQVPGQLQIWIALYDALNDDDDDVREVAALSAAPLLGRRIVAAEAADEMLQFLLQTSSTAEFRSIVVGRMVGHSSVVSPSETGSHFPEATDPWQPFAAQLKSALAIEDALFAVEEQNLYVDPVRETERWAEVFVALFENRASTLAIKDTAGDEAAVGREVNALQDWIMAGLHELLTVIEARPDDGPLGWTSKARVFALCARLLVSGRALVRARCPAHEEVRSALEKVANLGQKRRLHGLLLDVAKVST
jgi:hypothetical protein